MAALLLFAVALPVATVATVACGRGNAGDASAAKTASADTLDALDSLDGTQPPTPTSANATPDVHARTTCAVAKPHAAGSQDGAIEFGGLRRTYILHVPPSYDGTRRTPLVLNLHGFSSNARQQAIYSGLPAKGDRVGFIVITPDGTGAPQHWTYPGLGDVDDAGFLGALLDRAAADLCVDEKRVYVAGMSNGSAFAQQLACKMPERIAAVAAVGALVFPARCGTDRPIAVIAFNGTEDACVPFQGGTSQCGQRLPVPAGEAAAADWAKHDGCNAEPARQRFSEHVRTVAYSECDGNAAVVLYVIEGGGHTWPGAIDVPRLGATTHEVNATDEIWSFFVAQGSAR